MRTTIASVLVTVAISLAMLAAAPGNFRNFERHNSEPLNGDILLTGDTRSPIRHLIVLVGENRSFDNVFATYTPSDPSEIIWNLLSQGIILNNGAPGPQAALATQQQATDATSYELSPSQTGPFANLPQPSTTLNALPIGPCPLAELLFSSDVFCSDVGLDATSQGLLSARGTGQPLYFHRPPFQIDPVPDCRYPSNLPNLPYSLIGASELNNCGQPFLADAIVTTTYTSNTGDPVHRFYQMWQQSDCSIANITADNPSGCKHDLFPWVAITVGWGFTNPPSTDQDTFQGGVAMGFYNMA